MIMCFFYHSYVILFDTALEHMDTDTTDQQQPESF